MTDSGAPYNSSTSKNSRLSQPRLSHTGSRELHFDTTESADTGGDKNEATPLLVDFEEGMISGEGGFKMYEVDDLVTLNVFCVRKGTVFHNKNLWMETGIMALLFWSTAFTAYFFHMDHFEKFVGKEVNIRAFISMFSTLIGLLLSFYTALNLGRWWQMRQALRQVTEGCKTLTMYLAASVTSDKEVLHKVQHYCRASIFLLFQLAAGKASPLREAVRNAYLEQDEAAALLALNPNMTFVQAEALWSWLGTIVQRLHEQGLTKGPPHFTQLMASVNSGRQGIAELECFLQTPIPKGYVHLLCLMVKMHNIILTMMMAMLLALRLSENTTSDVDHLRGNDVFRVSFRAFFMPFLYNAILFLNAEVTNPLGDDIHDFDFQLFDTDVQAGANMLAESPLKVPDFLKSDKKFAPPYKATAV